jgi:hypothetical protein
MTLKRHFCYTLYMRRFHLILFITLLFSSCGPGTTTATSSPQTPTSASSELLPATLTPEIPEPPLYTDSINPLTGQPVEDPSLLQMPAALLSISHFPVTARPQAGLSFAPFVFEIYITEGATRFLTAFYGQIPAPEIPVTGSCAVRSEIFTQTGLLLGGQVWHDANQNGSKDAWERGIGGVCVNLYNDELELLAQTTSDTNGYYGFNVEPGSYRIAVAKPGGMNFTQKDVWILEPAAAWTNALDVKDTLLAVDAGLFPLQVPEPASQLPLAKVGPVRSGRLVYADIATFFPGSCLIYAFASPEVLAELPQCGFVFHEIQGGGYMLDIDEMVRETKDHHKADHTFDYTSNIYDEALPAGGEEASRLDVYIAWLNQSAWVYNPLYQSWWRYVDTADPQAAGILHPEIDRLTNRQLHFENVIVLFTEHEVISPTNLRIHLEQGLVGNALLFRDGRKYDIHWTTAATEQEVESGNRKPIRFLYPDDKALFPLKPGHTWVLVVTPQTAITQQSAGAWLLLFSQPPGAK